MPRAKRKARPMHYAQLRLAVMRRWGLGDTPGKLAVRLQVPTERVHAAVAGDVRRVVNEYARGCKASEVAKSLEVPDAFVIYVFRRINALADDRTRRADRDRREWIERATDPERREPMAERQESGRGGSGRRGFRPLQSPTPPVPSP